MKNKIVSARGVYYDLTQSPWEYIDDNGKVFKFSSEKKLDMFIAKIKAKEEAWMKEAQKLEKLGYDIDEKYFVNIKRLPEIIYCGMLYK